MNAKRESTLLILLITFGLVTFVYATSPGTEQKSKENKNSYYLYTKSLTLNDSGVALVPSRYRWSVETSSAGFDMNGIRLPDSRVMLRLYDPDQNSTVLTAQMDLATAAKLQQELAEIVVKKLQDPTYQHHPQLYDSKDIPKMEIIGVDEHGYAILEEEEKS